jgi:hypothetical protein
MIRLQLQLLLLLWPAAVVAAAAEQEELRQLQREHEEAMREAHDVGVDVSVTLADLTMDVDGASHFFACVFEGLNVATAMQVDTAPHDGGIHHEPQLTVADIMAHAGYPVPRMSYLVQ